MTKPTVKGGLAPANAVDVKGRRCGMHRGVIWPALISGLAISGLSDTGVSPGRRFQPLIVGLAMAIWALTHFAGHDSRDPPGLTLAHQPAHSDHTPMQPAMGSRASGRLSGCQGVRQKSEDWVFHSKITNSPVLKFSYPKCR